MLIPSSHLLLVVVAVVVEAAVEAVASHHPLLLHQALEAVLGATVRVTHHLHQAGHHAAQVPVVSLCHITTQEPGQSSAQHLRVRGQRLAV